uniref:Serine-threonine/tyrosine-protein kinase catalytic domain-containing protein n=1 Tax=Panagrolaimus sp. ES5 TaxID=591445 RepID=A0AC34G1I0_9BILA
MIRCWETHSEARPTFKQIVTFMTEMVKHPKVADAPLPPIVYKHGHKPSMTPPTTRSSAPPGDNDQTNPISTASQATISTFVTSMTESTTTSSYDSMPTKGEGVTHNLCPPSYDSMPTKGEGVTHNLCPPYETKLAKPIMSLAPLERIASGDDSISSHDESTLHDNCSVKQSPYKIEKQPSLRQSKPSGSSLSQNNATITTTAAPSTSSSTSNLPFHKRIFRKSMEKPKTGPSQPLIQGSLSSAGSSTSSSPPSTQPPSRPPKRGVNNSPPLPSQLI